MTLEEALKMVRGICEGVQLTKAQHDTVQEACQVIETRCSDNPTTKLHEVTASQCQSEK